MNTRVVINSLQSNQNFLTPTEENGGLVNLTAGPVIEPQSDVVRVLIQCENDPGAGGSPSPAIDLNIYGAGSPRLNAFTGADDFGYPAGNLSHFALIENLDGSETSGLEGDFLQAGEVGSPAAGWWGQTFEYPRFTWMAFTHTTTAVFGNTFTVTLFY